jgi:cold shock CspA family protein/ribosome-associated translation inhibitor RaiA
MRRTGSHGLSRGTAPLAPAAASGLQSAYVRERPRGSTAEREQMEIHWHRPETFHEADRAAAEARLRELARDRTDLIDVRITARLSSHHRHGGQEVRITCKARGTEIVAARARDDAGLALNETLDVFEREVWRMRHRHTQVRSERPAGPPELGVIDRVFPEQGYGFILTDGGDSVYFHRNALSGGLAFDALGEGQRVGLNLEGGVDGPQATVVVPAPPDAVSP